MSRYPSFVLSGFGGENEALRRFCFYIRRKFVVSRPPQPRARKVVLTEFEKLYSAQALPLCRH